MIERNLTVPRNEIFQPASFGNLNDLSINSCPKELKFWGDEDDDFKNTSPKDFNESPHGLRRIERNRSKSGVYSRNAKSTRTLILKSSWFLEVLHEARGIRITSKSSKNHTNLVLHYQTNEIKNRHKPRHETYDIEHEFKARRAQGGKGLLSQTIYIQGLNNPWIKSYPREEREELQEGDREGTPGREAACSVAGKKREGESGEGERYLTPTNSRIKD